MKDPNIEQSEVEHEVLPLYKELFVRKGDEDWNEITLNTGGVASTLQDIKAQHRSGGYVYSKNRNRFIYWKTSHNVLELVEESLDLNLLGNQVRYKFTDSPVLEGISITETSDQIIILVPTVSSLHRLTYPHPDQLLQKSFRDQAAHSIFVNASEADAMDPASYSVLDTALGGVVCGASCLGPDHEGVFALSLSNMSILLIRMFNGETRAMTLSSDAIVPIRRFFSGLTEAIMRKEVHEGLGMSLVLHYMNRRLCLFSLDRQGTLKAWCCETGTLLGSINLFPKTEPSTMRYNHKMVKSTQSRGFVLYCCLQGCSLFSVAPKFTNNRSVEFKLLSSFKSSLELFEMAPGPRNELWCIWLLVGDVTPLITKINMDQPSSWMSVTLSKPPFEVKRSNFFAQDCATRYLDAIFSSGFFTPKAVEKALSVCQSNALIKSGIDVRAQICAIVEVEIYSEVGDQALDDDEFLEISERCWSRIYSCCTQFLLSDLLPLGFIWLGPSNLVLIRDSGFSLVSEKDHLEWFWTKTLAEIEDPISVQAKFGTTLETIREIDMDESVERLNLSLHLGQSRMLPEIAATFDPDSKKEMDTQTLPDLINVLHKPAFYEPDNNEWNSFCSHSGLSAVISAFRDFCRIRLNICQKLLLNLKEKANSSVSYLNHVADLCRIYYVLEWSCVTNESPGVPLIYGYALTHRGTIMQNTLENSVLSLAQALWPKPDNLSLATHLYSNKHYCLVQDLARITGNHISFQWKLLLAETYLKSGECGKAYDICAGAVSSDVADHLKVIRLFESHSRSDLAVSMATLAISRSNISDSDLETLQSVLFIHELHLKHYTAASVQILNCSSYSRQCDFLHRLVTTMIGDGRSSELLNLPFGQLSHVFTKFLHTRAHSLPFPQAIHFYNILYSFYSKNTNYKKAAEVMFEKALKSDSPEMQWRCYGACLNSLMLLPPDSRWLPRPASDASRDERSIDVVELNDIRKYYELAGARYSLGDCPLEATPQDVVDLCVSNREYRIAMRIATMFNLSCVSIIHSLTAACASLPDTKDWHWLKSNECDDMVVTETNAESRSWSVLRWFIEKYETGPSTELHRAAAQKLLELRMFLPFWLSSSYKKKHAAELLKLYMHLGYLEEASALAVEYLEAAMGVGKEAFSIEKPLMVTSPPIWVPINTIDLLIKELKHYSMEVVLVKTLTKYVDLAKRITEDKERLLCSS